MWQRTQQILWPEITLFVCGEKVWVIANRGQPTVETIRVLVDSGPATTHRRPVAFGNDARPIEMSTVDSWQVVVPFTSSNIQDEALSVEYIRWLLGKIMGKVWIFRPRVTIVLSGQSSSFVQELWLHVAAAVGARSVVFIHPFLAAVTGLIDGVIADNELHAVGLWQAAQLELGIVSRGHVQALWNCPVEEERDWVQVWRQWLPRLSTEARATIERQGLLLISDQTDVDVLALSQLLDVPVVLVPPTKVVLGARKRGQVG